LAIVIIYLILTHQSNTKGESKLIAFNETKPKNESKTTTLEIIKEPDLSKMQKDIFESSEHYSKRLANTHFLAGSATMKSYDADREEMKLSLKYDTKVLKITQSDKKLSSITLHIPNLEAKSIFNDKDTIEFYIQIMAYDSEVGISKISLFSNQKHYYNNLKIVWIYKLMVIDDKEISNKRLNWKEAMEYTKSLSYLGYSDWRLPTQDELWKIYQHKEQFKEIDRDGWYWSTTENTEYKGSAWVVSFYSGNVNWDKHTSKSYVLCMRGE